MPLMPLEATSCPWRLEQLSGRGQSAPSDQGQDSLHGRMAWALGSAEASSTSTPLGYPTRFLGPFRGRTGNSTGSGRWPSGIFHLGWE